MAVIAGTTIERHLSPRVVTIPSTDNSITVEDLQDTLQDLEDDELSMVWPKLRITTGDQDLGGGVSVGLTMQLQDTQIAFAPRTTSDESGTVTTANAAGTTLIDSTALFVTNGVTVGATIINFTDQSVTTVKSIDSETQLTHYALADGTDNSWDSADVYKVWNEVQVEIGGGNTVAVNPAGDSISAIFPTFGTQVLKTSSSSATSSNSIDLEYASYAGAINIDAVNGTTAALGATGSVREPFDNLADALAEDVIQGFGELHFFSDFTFGATDDVDGYTLRGQHMTDTMLTFTAGCSTSDVFFTECTVTGTVDGAVNAREVLFVDIAGVGCTTNDMIWEYCLFEGTLTLRNDNNVQVTFVGGHSNVAGTGTFIFDLNGTVTPLKVSGYVGGFELLNKTAAVNSSIDMDGHFKLGATNTGGTLTLRGQGKLTDTNGGATLDAAEFIQASVLQGSIERTTYTGKNGIGISIAPTSGVDGIAWPLGTPSDPCKTEQNLFDIDSQVIFYKNVYIEESLTLVQDHSADPHNYFGANPQDVVLTLDAASDLSGSQFADLFITGKMGVAGGSIIRECIVGDITNINGFIYNSTIFGDITVNGNLSMEGCWIAPTAPGQETTIDFNGLANTVIVSDWSAGRIRGINMVTGSFLGVAGTGGRLITDTSNTGGTMVYAGAIGVDDTFGANLDLLKDSTTSGQVWTHNSGRVTALNARNKL